MKKKSYCTLSPDINFGETCCGRHDADYTRGGDKDDRLIADIRLRNCIKDHGYPYLCWVYFFFVRMLGWAFFRYDEEK